ncbi:MAG: ParB/RepB/Spo0J family partition protein, partial [Desulfobulbia bacterium]
VAGERRWRASQEAGLQTIPVIVRDLNEQEVLEIALIENVQRSDLNAIEEAQGYRELLDKYKYTQDDLSRIIGKSRSHLANTMRLLKLPDNVQNLVRVGSLSAGHARALVGREDADRIAREIVERRLNVRDVEALIQKARGSSKGKSRIGKSADIRALERELSEELGLVILISPRTGEAGEIRIRYNSLEQFEDIHERLARRG